MDLRWSYILFQFSIFLVFRLFWLSTLQKISQTGHGLSCFDSFAFDLRGFDFVIICCSDLSAENYWQELSFQGFHIWALWVIIDVDVLQFGVICHVSFSVFVLWKRASFHVQERLTQTIREVTGTSSTVICVHEDRNVWRGKGCWIFIANQPTFTRKERRWVPTVEFLRIGMVVLEMAWERSMPL